MSTVSVSYNFDDGEISATNAFRIYQKHLELGKPFNYYKVLGNIYIADSNTEEYNNASWVNISLWNPDIINMD